MRRPGASGQAAARAGFVGLDVALSFPSFCACAAGRVDWVRGASFVEGPGSTLFQRGTAGACACASQRTQRSAAGACASRGVLNKRRLVRLCWSRSGERKSRRCGWCITGRRVGDVDDRAD